MRSLTTALQRRVAELAQEAIRKDDQPLPSMAEIARAASCEVKTVQRVVGSEYTYLRRKRGAELRRLALYTCACGNPKSRRARQCIRCKAKSARGVCRWRTGWEPCLRATSPSIERHWG